MHLSRRTMITAAATGAAAAGVTLVSALPASASPRRFRTRPSPRMRRRPTEYDRTRKQQNPANNLGCPLGRGF
ncbi:hypothetical protein [Nesterenkonia sp. AN1]|nr:hypothetical protein [Nesterenkonia sp. AN1]